jgi:hypothetical protein
LQLLEELLFLLASRDRLTLFSEIGVEKRRSGQLSAKLSAKSQEASKTVATADARFILISILILF